MRYLFLIGWLTTTVASHSQTLRMITTLTNGSRDTIQFGFVQNATQDEDISLGERNLFMTPVQGYEGRILQRDSINFSCGSDFDIPDIYYPTNFDSRVNYRDIRDTSLQNRSFEIWYSDGETDSVEIICDIPFSSFILTGYQHLTDCDGEFPSPVGILVVHEDTIRHIKYKIQLGLGIKELILITRPDLILTTLAGNTVDENKADISIYPNPVTDKFFVRYDNPLNLSEIFIYNSIGVLIEHLNAIPDRSEIHLEKYCSGPYIIMFVTEDGRHILKKILKL